MHMLSDNIAGSLNVFLYRRRIRAHCIYLVMVLILLTEAKHRTNTSVFVVKKDTIMLL